MSWYRYMSRDADGSFKLEEEDGEYNYEKYTYRPKYMYVNTS